MSYKTGILIVGVALATVLSVPATRAEGVRGGYSYWDMPPPAKPHQYGDVLMNRVSVRNGEKPVLFSHWLHRMKYTCRVCHFELDFQMAANKTEITEEDNRNGRFCGACHDGVHLFGHTEGNCERCHTGTARSAREKFEEKTGKLVRAQHGNGIDWAEALSAGQITPRYSIFDEEESPIDFDKTLSLEAEWTFVPPAYFPHKEHVQWLDCANCHPDIFTVKKKTTKHFRMDYILEGKFCGACHLTVAFPVRDCGRCHPELR